MSLLIDMAENALLPDGFIRFGIRRLDKKRLRVEGQAHRSRSRRRRDRFIAEMRQSPIAMKTRSADEQHYEVPAAGCSAGGCSLWPVPNCGITMTAGSGSFPTIS